VALVPMPGKLKFDQDWLEWFFLMHDEAAVNDDVYVYLRREPSSTSEIPSCWTTARTTRKPSRIGSPIFRRPQAESSTLGSSRQQSCRAIASSRSIPPISMIEGTKALRP
jgi:hypothetical protein